MGKINLGRVILGGLAAGVVVNVFDGVLNGVVLADRWAALARTLGHSALMSPVQIAVINALGFATGILAVWLYSGIRSRFGAGPATAIHIAFVLWALVNAIPNAYMIAIGVLPIDLTGIVIGVGLVEYPLAILAGAALYKESA
jgi:hypothetical protein